MYRFLFFCAIRVNADNFRRKILGIMLLSLITYAQKIAYIFVQNTYK